MGSEMCIRDRINTIAAEISEILAAIAKCWVLISDGAELLDDQIKRMVSSKGLRLAPQGFPHKLSSVADAMQGLLCAVVNTGNTLKGEKTCQSEDQLIIKLMRRIGGLIIESLLQIVIIKKGNKEATGITVAV